MSSHIGTEQAAIMAALTALPALAGVEVKAATGTKDVFNLNLDRAPTVFVVYGGFARQGGQTVGNHGAQSLGPSMWYLVGVVSDFTTPTSALTKTLGAFELCEAIRGVRGSNISATSDPMYMVLHKEELVEGERQPRGGQVGYLCTYMSSFHRV